MTEHAPTRLEINLNLFIMEGALKVERLKNVKEIKRKRKMTDKDRRENKENENKRETEERKDKKRKRKKDKEEKDRREQLKTQSFKSISGKYLLYQANTNTCHNIKSNATYCHTN